MTDSGGFQVMSMASRDLITPTSPLYSHTLPEEDDAKL